MERLKKKELLDLIASLEIDRKDFMIVSSGALVLRGILEDAGDLDISVNEEGLKSLKKKFNVKLKKDNIYEVSDRIECFLDDESQWKMEFCEGYQVQDIKDYYEYLLTSSREKDKARIPIVDDYIKTNYLKENEDSKNYDI